MTRRALATTLAALLAVPAAGCSGSSTTVVRTVVAVSDIHFDPFFDPALVSQLQASPESEWASIFARSQHQDPGWYGETTNFVLLQRALASVRARRPALVIFGGDLLVQEFADFYYLRTGTRDEAAMRAFALKTVTFLVHQVRAALGTTPVYFTLGNWDDYAGSFGLQPGDSFLADTADLFRRDLLLGTADPASFDATYRAGGYYAADVPGTDVVVIGLNTLFLAPQAPAGISAAVDQELSWLDATLDAVQSSGRRAWIVAHVPPGGDLATTGQHVNPDGQIAQVTMLLVPGDQERLLGILEAHRDAIAAAFTGHTHMDEYRLAAVPMQGIPGVTSDMGNAPAFKTFTIGAGSELQDYVSWTLDLATPSAPFLPSYDFSTAYGLPAPLGPSLATLAGQLASPGPAETSYRGYYGSGHTPETPITDLNWPVYRCGISFMGAQGLTDCATAR